MKLGKLEAVLFGSYPKLSLDLSNTGLALICGPTGAGKSTLFDAVTWALYGQTAKGGNVSEVRSWHGENLPTAVTCQVTLDTNNILITRVRGTPQENDLHYILDGVGPVRGANIQDTQKQLDTLLGADYTTFVISCNFNEFSDTGRFFTAKAKDRREVFERVADLSFPVNLHEKLSESKKLLKKYIENSQRTIATITGRLEQLKRSLEDTKCRERVWRNNHTTETTELANLALNFESYKVAKVDDLRQRSFRFDDEKRKKEFDIIDKIDALYQTIVPNEVLAHRLEIERQKQAKSADKCPTCNRTLAAVDTTEKIKEEIRENTRLQERVTEQKIKLKDLQSQRNPYKEQIEQAANETNSYTAVLAKHKTQVNPFTSQVDHTLGLLKSDEQTLVEGQMTLVQGQKEYSAFNQLQDHAITFKATLLEQTVQNAQNQMNQYIQKYFDSEFQVEFKPNDSDGIDINIKKNGYECVFTQLSKGQRQILKLTFAVTVMGLAANNAATSFNLLLFDEALDGLDVNLKVKAVGLFEELSQSHPSILVIDHAEEIKGFFNTHYQVTLNGDESSVTVV